MKTAKPSTTGSMIEPNLFTLDDFLDAAKAIRAFDLMPTSRLELTRGEFERLKQLCAPHMQAAAPGAAPMFTGLKIEVREP